MTGAWVLIREDRFPHPGTGRGMIPIKSGMVCTLVQEADQKQEIDDLWPGGTWSEANNCFVVEERVVEEG